MKRPAPVHELMLLVQGGTPNHRHLRRRLVIILVWTVGIDLVCSAIAYAVECDAPGSQIHSYGVSLFWTTTQLLTVSSQLINPVTTAGRWLDVVMEFIGITVIAALAGSLGSFLYRRSVEDSPLHPKLNEFLEKFKRSGLIEKFEARERVHEELATGTGAGTGDGPVSGSATPSG